EDLLMHSDNFYDLTEKQDRQAIEIELSLAAQNAHNGSSDLNNVSATTTASSLSSSEDNSARRIFLCRMNASRNSRRQMRFGDQKVVLVEGHFFGHLRLNSKKEAVFLATCTPIAMPETRECIVQGSTSVFTSIHSMDMRFIYVDSVGEHHLGASNEELSSASWYALVHDQHLADAQLKHKRITQSEQERSTILLARFVNRQTLNFFWVHVVMQVKESSDGAGQPVIVCTNQVLSEREACVMRANSWLYQFYSLHSKLHYNLSSTQLDNGVDELGIEGVGCETSHELDEDTDTVGARKSQLQARDDKRSVRHNNNDNHTNGLTALKEADNADEVENIETRTAIQTTKRRRRRRRHNNQSPDDSTDSLNGPQQTVADADNADNDCVKSKRRATAENTKAADTKRKRHNIEADTASLLGAIPAAMCVATNNDVAVTQQSTITRHHAKSSSIGSSSSSSSVVSSASPASIMSSYSPLSNKNNTLNATAAYTVESPYSMTNQNHQYYHQQQHSTHQHQQHQVQLQDHQQTYQQQNYSHHQQQQNHQMIGTHQHHAQQQQQSQQAQWASYHDHSRHSAYTAPQENAATANVHPAQHQTATTIDNNNIFSRKAVVDATAPYPATLASSYTNYTAPTGPTTVAAAAAAAAVVSPASSAAAAAAHYHPSAFGSVYTHHPHSHPHHHHHTSSYAAAAAVQAAAQHHVAAAAVAAAHHHAYGYHHHHRHGHQHAIAAAVNAAST
ncbi:Neuronal PAS domain-containing protein 4, partial [Fragariocoptes setiger]